MKFRLIRGVHHENGITYEKDGIVESAMDLTTLNSVGSIRFQKVESDFTGAAAAGFNTIHTDSKKSVPSGPDEFDSMSVPDLKKFASQEGIDLGSATKKDDILLVIREAVKVILAS